MIDEYWTKEAFILRCIRSMDIALVNTIVINDNARAIRRYLKIAEVLSKLYMGNHADFNVQKVTCINSILDKYWVKLLPTRMDIKPKLKEKK